jgi:L,D-transpeptidase catalytic domain
MKKIVLALVTLATAVPAARAAAPASDLAPALLKQAPGLRANVLELAMNAAERAAKKGLVRKTNLLTVIDYSLPSTQPRLFVFDLAAKKLLYRELVAHGKNSGGVVPNFFSNEHGSEATSLGLFVTADTYNGSNGYSLRLKGLEAGINDAAFSRAIVMHGAYYVSKEAIKALGRLGRSWGCPAVRPEVAKEIINTIRGGSAIFAYYPEKRWLTQSAYLH